VYVSDVWLFTKTIVLVEMEEVSEMFAFNSTLTQLFALPEKSLKEMFSWLMEEDCLCQSTVNIS
jgi:hypothetical protein